LAANSSDEIESESWSRSGDEVEAGSKVEEGLKAPNPIVLDGIPGSWAGKRREEGEKD